MFVCLFVCLFVCFFACLYVCAQLCCLVVKKLGQGQLFFSEMGRISLFLIKRMFVSLLFWKNIFVFNRNSVVCLRVCFLGRIFLFLIKRIFVCYLERIYFNIKRMLIICLAWNSFVRWRRNPGVDSWDRWTIGRRDAIVWKWKWKEKEKVKRSFYHPMEWKLKRRTWIRVQIRCRFWCCITGESRQIYKMFWETMNL